MVPSAVHLWLARRTEGMTLLVFFILICTLLAIWRPIIRSILKLTSSPWSYYLPSCMLRLNRTTRKTQPFWESYYFATSSFTLETQRLISLPCVVVNTLRITSLLAPLVARITINTVFLRLNKVALIVMKLWLILSRLWVILDFYTFNPPLTTEKKLHFQN